MEYSTFWTMKATSQKYDVQNTLQVILPRQGKSGKKGERGEKGEEKRREGREKGKEKETWKEKIEKVV